MSNVFYGDQTDNVGYLQKGLNAAGASPQLLVDKDFKTKTATALIATPEVQAVIQKFVAAGVGGPIIPPPIVIPPHGGPLFGTDIYHGDSVNSWGTLAQNIQFIFIKASDGYGSDPMYAVNFPAAKAAGLIAAPYHFGEWGEDPTRQANAYVASIKAGGGLAATDDAPVLDWEYADGRLPSSADIAGAKVFVLAVEAILKRVVITYASKYLFDHLKSIGDTFFTSRPMWEAAYRGLAPSDGEAFWQNSANAAIPGLNDGKAVSDQDKFFGSTDDLKALIAKTVIA